MRNPLDLFKSTIEGLQQERIVEAAVSGWNSVVEFAAHIDEV